MRTLLHVPPHKQPAIDGPLVVTLRRRAGKTQTALADAAGISKQYLSDIEIGRRKGANPAVQVGIARALGVPVDVILTGVVAA